MSSIQSSFSYQAEEEDPSDGEIEHSIWSLSQASATSYYDKSDSTYREPDDNESMCGSCYSNAEGRENSEWVEPADVQHVQAKIHNIQAHVAEGDVSAELALAILNEANGNHESAKLYLDMKIAKLMKKKVVDTMDQAVKLLDKNCGSVSKSIEEYQSGLAVIQQVVHHYDMEAARDTLIKNNYDASQSINMIKQIAREYIQSRHPLMGILAVEDILGRHFWNIADAVHAMDTNTAAATLDGNQCHNQPCQDDNDRTAGELNIYCNICKYEIMTTGNTVKGKGFCSAGCNNSKSVCAACEISWWNQHISTSSGCAFCKAKLVYPVDI